MKLLKYEETEENISFDFVDSKSIEFLKNNAYEDIVEFQWVQFEGNIRLVLKVELPCYDGPLSQEVHLIDFENMRHYFIDEKMYQKIISK